MAVVSDLQREDIHAYLNTLTSRGLKARAVKDAVDRLFGLLHELQEEGQPSNGQDLDEFNDIPF